MIRLNDIFWTFQGEGANWGRRALFVRVPHCNLACSWCDTEFNTFTKFEVADIEIIATHEPTRFAVLTGGEPMMSLQSPKIVEILKHQGFEIACETNGTFPIIAGIDFVTVSPKKDADYFVHQDALNKCNELKLVVDKDFDFSITQKFDNALSYNCRKTLSPEFHNMDESVEKITNFIKENPTWRLSLQTHKWLKIK